MNVRATDFDHYRGTWQGRISPSLVTAPDGSKVFLLGSENDRERAILSAGDYTEISQVVDLDGIDLVGATMDTIGRVLDSKLVAAQLPTVADTLLNYPMNQPRSGALDDALGEHHLQAQGDLTFGDSSYGAGDGLCRVIPVNSTTAKLIGSNAPQILPPTGLGSYTLDFWLTFDANAHPDSAGIDPIIFDLSDGNDGLRVWLSGATPSPAHSWFIAITHYNGGASETRLFPIPLTVSIPWTFVTIVFPAAGGVADGYINGAFVAPTTAIFTIAPGQPSAGTPIQVADPDLWGEIDSVRLSSSAHLSGQISTDYNTTLAAAATKDYEWIMEILVDDQTFARRIIGESERRRWTEFLAPVRRVSGIHRVTFRLQIREA